MTRNDGSRTSARSEPPSPGSSDENGSRLGIAPSATTNASAPIALVPRKSVRQPIVSRAAPISGPAHEPDVLHDALGRERVLVALARHEIGEQGLLGGEQGSTGGAQADHEREAEQHVVPHEREARSEHDEAGGRDEDRPPAADPVRELAPELARDHCCDRRARRRPGRARSGTTRASGAPTGRGSSPAPTRRSPAGTPRRAPAGWRDRSRRRCASTPSAPRSAGSVVTGDGRRGEEWATPLAVYRTSSQASSSSSGTPASSPR